MTELVPSLHSKRLSEESAKELKSIWNDSLKPEAWELLIL